ncbi:ferritin [candidate division TA06 bacterium SM23_40]|uniref:Ferritin n=1 Tax=candidate division TA06 bacterium SM23_40 TaxID=1703774 RepID=A0A0S8G4G0_UNCT6|nr:MAG: ferritin [candidate division TA06 bacterium SM23_40]
MIKKKIRDAFNEQIQHELYSAYLYLSMAAYCHSIGLDGMAQWLRVQTMEEMTHAMKFFDHIIERDGKVELLPIKKPKITWKSPLEGFQDAYKHEQFITGRINELVKLSNAEKDYASNSLLQWFVDEQVEEEASASKVVQQLEMVGDSGNGLLMLDRELGQRTFTWPTAKEGEGE